MFAYIKILFYLCSVIIKETEIMSAKIKLFYVVEGTQLQSYVIEDGDLSCFCNYESDTIDVATHEGNKNELLDYIRKGGIDTTNFEVHQLRP